MTSSYQLLMVDNSPNDIEFIVELLRVRGKLAFEYRHVMVYDDLKSALMTQSWDLILCDFMIPLLSPFTVIQLAKQRQPRSPVLLISGQATLQDAVDMMRLGARGFIEKLDHERLIGMVKEELEISRMVRTHKVAEQEVRLLQTAVMQSEEAIIITDHNLTIKFVNPAFATITGYPAEELLEHSVIELLSRYQSMDDDFEFIPLSTLREVKQLGLRGEFKRQDKDGHEYYIAWSTTPLRDEPGNIVNYITVIWDISESKRQQAFQAQLSLILEAIAEDHPLPDILKTLVLTIERYHPDILASILLLDAPTATLHHGAALSLPESYCQAIDGSRIGAGVGSCGTAAYEKRLVIVEDIATHPYWVNFRDLAMQYGLRACWSQPILNPEGEVLGTFALYYGYPNSPTESQLALIRLAAHVAGIAISRSQEHAVIRASEEKYRSLIESSDAAISMVDVTGRYLYLNHIAAAPFGVPPEALVNKTVFDLFPSEEASAVMADVRWVIARNQGLVLEPQVTNTGKHLLVSH